MDYESEQAMEMEALEAILADDLEEFDGTNPDGWALGPTFKILIDPREDGEEPADESDEKSMELLFAHSASYPDEPPCLRLRAVRGLSDKDIAQGMEHLKQQVEDNLGMAMIFQLVTAAKEWLRCECAQTHPCVFAVHALSQDAEGMHAIWVRRLHPMKNADCKCMAVRSYFMLTRYLLLACARAAHVQTAAHVELPLEERKRRDAEEEARRNTIRLQGTMCTFDIFMDWKKKVGGRLLLLRRVSTSNCARLLPLKPVRW